MADTFSPLTPKRRTGVLFFFINAACLRECNDGKCNKQDNKCIYSVCAGGLSCDLRLLVCFLTACMRSMGLSEITPL